MTSPATTFSKKLLNNSTGKAPVDCAQILFHFHYNFVLLFPSIGRLFQRVLPKITKISNKFKREIERR